MARFGMDLPANIIEEQIASALDLLVMSVRIESGKRFVTSLSEVSQGSSGHVRLTECVSFDQVHAEWSLVKEPSFLSHLVLAKLVKKEEVNAWKQQVCAA